ncbi:MAG: SdpI family protein [Lachnospiraceae bacterium]|nr:SdpI family protein [Lachnospiraceae bacterium]
MKKAMWALSFITLIGTAVAVQFLPESVPMHMDFEGNIDRWGSRYENLIFPVIIIIMSLFWTLFINYFEKKAKKTDDEKAAAESMSNAKVMSVVGFSMAVMFTVMHAFMVYADFVASPDMVKSPVDIGKVSVILMGILMIVLGNYMTKTRINSAVGFRISWSMYNENTWQKTNRFGAILIMIAGLLSAVLGVVLESSIVSTFAALGLIILVSIITVVYAHKVYLEETGKR